MTTGAPTLSWVLPLYRTTAQLDELLARIHAVSAELVDAHEIILVDDACPEGCGAAADAHAARDGRVRVLHRPANGGQDAALRAGLALARGDWTMILDADLQDPPEAVRAFWARRDVGRDGVVFAERTGAYDTRGRHLTGRAFRVLATWIGDLPRGACLFALLGRGVVDALAASDADRRSLLAMLARHAHRRVSLPVARARRSAGTSSYGSSARLARAASVLWQLLRARVTRAATASPSLPAEPR